MLPCSTRALASATLLLAAFAGCSPILAAGPSPHTGGPLAAAFAPLLADTALDHAHWGVLVRSARTGETLFAHNADRLFTPASNQKLVTGALVLETLGPAFRFRTEVAASGPVQNGVLRGPLVVRGTGDPTVSRRFDEDPRDRFRAFADSLRARGIQRVAGGIIGVDSAFVDGPLGAGWAWDDVLPSYAAEFGALQFNEGAVEVAVVPGTRIGEAAVVILTPATQYVSVSNQTVTTAPGGTTRISIARDAVGAGLIVSGEIAAASDPFRRNVAVRDPTLFYLSAMRETLREVGVLVEGPVVNARDLDPAEGTVRRALPVFAYRSAPLGDIVTAMMKPSQNQIAEALLRTAGLEVRGEGSARAGTQLADSLFVAWNLPTERRLADGSGMSRYNLLSPALLVALLQHMERSPSREAWHASLPVAGVDGTLANRMRGTPLAGNVRAKTGTLSGVRALSGYMTSRSGEPLVFSIMVNHHVRSAAAADQLVDAALLRVWDR
jgi:serine-type D-Ala-D-Ala carboxypeptidase/endopeptidase (penicillin-binding protein 4)